MTGEGLPETVLGYLLCEVFGQGYLNERGVTPYDRGVGFEERRTAEPGEKRAKV